MRASLVAAAFLGWSAAAQSPQITRYLESHREALDLANFDAKLLDVRDKQVILLGETHGIAVNEDLDLALLKYLHREAGVRVYVAEIGYSAGLLLTSYLDGGSDAVLDYVMGQFKGSPAWTKERRAFWVRLREWNQTLPRADRVRIVGADIEHQVDIAFAVLDKLAPAADAPESIAGQAAKLHSIIRTRQSRAALSTIAGDVSESLKAHHADWESAIGARLFDFEMVVENLLLAKAFYERPETPEGFALREQALYDNFRKIYPRIGGRWYGRWGSAHVLQRRSENRDRFAQMLNRPESPVAGKVATIWMLYPSGSGNPFPAEIFRASAPGPLTLFRLAGEGSPFERKMSLFLRGEAPPAEFVDYVLLARDASPSHPMETSQTARFDELQPVVVRTVPEAGRRDVPSNLGEVRITFSKDMYEHGWAFCTVQGYDSPPLTGLHFEPDHRTVAGAVKLAPGRSYAVWINGEGDCKSFRDPQGHFAVPYLLTFETAKQ